LPIQLAQNAVFVFVGLYLAKRVGFGAPMLDSLLERRGAKAYLKSVVGISTAFGVLESVLIAGIDYLFPLSLNHHLLINRLPSLHRFGNVS